MMEEKSLEKAEEYVHISLPMMPKGTVIHINGGETWFVIDTAGYPKMPLKNFHKNEDGSFTYLPETPE